LLSYDLQNLVVILVGTVNPALLNNLPYSVVITTFLVEVVLKIMDVIPASGGCDLDETTAYIMESDLTD